MVQNYRNRNFSDTPASLVVVTLYTGYMTDELVDIIDKNNEIIGKAMKSEVHQNGWRHRLAAVLLQNEGGKYLIPTTSEKKMEVGKLTFSAAGHVQSNDNYVKSACRELREETGLEAKENQAELLGSFWLEKDYPTRSEKERFEVFKIKYNPIMGKVILNEEQINEQWLSEEELKEIYENYSDKLSSALRLTCKNLFKFGENSF